MPDLPVGFAILAVETQKHECTTASSPDTYKQHSFCFEVLYTKVSLLSQALIMSY